MGRLKLANEADAPEDSGQMCEGKSWAWNMNAHYREPHPAHLRHPDCMRCGRDMGCVRCSGIAKELMCRNCLDWAHPAALEEHGRMLKTPEERAEGIRMLRSIVGSFARKSA